MIDLDLLSAKVTCIAGLAALLVSPSAARATAADVAQVTGRDVRVELQQNTECSFITGNNVNIRQGPGLGFPVVAQLNRGDGVRAQFRRGNWVRLAARVIGFPPDERYIPLDGWVFNEFINGCSEDQFDRWRTPSASQSNESPVVALDSEGLRLIYPPTGSTRLLSFGASDNDVVTILRNLLGQPRERALNRECGAGPLTITSWPSGLSVLSSDGDFVGWTVDGRDAGAERFTTIAGLGVGSTRSELTQALTADIRQTTLGTEFIAGGLGGILSSGRANAEVTLMYAGTTCFFR